MNALKTLLPAAVLAAGLAAAASSHAATTITIGLQQAGVNGGAITNEGSNPGSDVFSASYGTFQVNLVTGLAGILPDIFNSSAQDQTSAGGTLDVYVTASGLTTPLGLQGFDSVFTSNALPAGWTVTTTTYLSTSNALFGGTQLSSNMFSSTGTNNGLANLATGAGPYSITEQYHIVATGAGQSNTTIDVFAVPEPATWALMIMGFGGVGALVRGRRNRPVAATA